MSIEIHDAELHLRDKRIVELEKALERLASPEAFVISRTIYPIKDAELLARMRYADSFFIGGDS